jgi:hypothetical protein
MNVFTKHVVLGAAGMLILQPAVVSSAQETVPSPASAPGSAPPTGKIAAAESSQNQDRPGTGSSSNGAIAQPGKRVAREILHSEGNATRFIGLRKSDSVDVNFTFSPDFNQTLTVQPDGFVALKGAGTLLAEGLTVPQMQQAVVQCLPRLSARAGGHRDLERILTSLTSSLRAR